MIRAILAATLSPSWGIYSGYELCENVPIRPGSEEYLDSEKYQYRPRDWAAEQGISALITRLNAIRKSHRALRGLRNLRFHYVDQPDLICFSKHVPRYEASSRAGTIGAPGSDTVLVVVNLDPHQTREATVWLDLPALGFTEPSVTTGEFSATDELTGETYRWGPANYVRLDPTVRPAHIFAITTGTEEKIP